MPTHRGPAITTLPPLRAVQVFEAVGRAGSVSRAAEALGVSPGAVTQQIRVLEKHLGVQMVGRNGRGIELTPWGALYLQRVSAGMDQLRLAQDELERARRSNHLAVSALPSLASKWLGTILFDWQRQHPEARVMLEGLDAESRLEGGEADFRISYGARRRHHQRSTRLFNDYVVAVASPTLLGKALRLRQPRDLLKQPLLWIDWGPEHVAPPTWFDWFAAAGIAAGALRADLTFSLSGAVVDAAIDGRGFALAQNSMAAAALASGALVKVFPLELPLPEPYFLAWRAAALDRELGATFHAWLVNEARRFDHHPDRP